MAKLSILEFPDPRLRKKAQPVDAVDDALRAQQSKRARSGRGRLVLRRVRSFTLSHWGVEATSLGPVMCMRWSPDESALAVG